MLTATTATPATAVPAGAVTGAVRGLLRLESLAILTVVLAAYHLQGASWGLFAALFLVPDLAMLPYLKSRVAGAAAYNAAHSYVTPALLLGVAVGMNNPQLLAGATIWAAHIAFDRVVGYGLKYSTNFNDTHLGRVGRSPVAE